ncbi:hypothetical protein AAY473_027011 [Plecturocebus cupreus]
MGTGCVHQQHCAHMSKATSAVSLHLTQVIWNLVGIFIPKPHMGFHHDGQAGLELLTSGDPPTSASQSARITGKQSSVMLASLVFEILASNNPPTSASQSWSAVTQSRLTAASASWVQAILLPQPPQQLGLQASTVIPS